jgi:hypothetical protein
VLSIVAVEWTLPMGKACARCLGGASQGAADAGFGDDLKVERRTSRPSGMRQQRPVVTVISRTRQFD